MDDRYLEILEEKISKRLIWYRIEMSILRDASKEEREQFNQKITDQICTEIANEIIKRNIPDIKVNTDKWTAIYEVSVLVLDPANPQDMQDVYDYLTYKSWW